MLLTLPKVQSKLGQANFTVSGGSLVLTDPCYRDATERSGVIVGARNGSWLAEVGYYRDPNDVESFAHSIETLRGLLAERRATEPTDAELVGFLSTKIAQTERAQVIYPGRVTYLRVWHAGIDPDDPVAHRELPSTVGVDSGQVGFFDQARFRVVCGEGFDAFYDRVCRLTNGEAKFGAVEFGAVSSAGYGDGTYEAYVRHDDAGQVVSAAVVFIIPDEL